MSITTEAEEIAKDALAEIRAGNIEDRDALFTWIHETVDGCSTVIYTAEAKEYLMKSDNDGRAVSEGLVDASSFRDGIPWSAMAYGALEADVFEALDAIGVDVNDDSEWPREADDESEEESDDDDTSRDATPTDDTSIPADYEVQPLRPDEHPPGRTTCDTCGRAWDDDKVTGITPAPSGRCPFENWHEDDTEGKAE